MKPEICKCCAGPILTEPAPALENPNLCQNCLDRLEWATPTLLPAKPLSKLEERLNTHPATN